MTKRRVTIQIREPADTPSRYAGLKAGDRLTLPARAAPAAPMTEAELIAALQARGIGRPSTLELIVDGLAKHGYVTRQGSGLIVTELGRVVNDYLGANFSDLFDLGFTARFEGQLDAMAQGRRSMCPCWRRCGRRFRAPPPTRRARRSLRRTVAPRRISQMSRKTKTVITARRRRIEAHALQNKINARSYPRG